MKTVIGFAKRHLYLSVFLILLLVVFAVYQQSLHLTLYGDDWLVISKHWGGYGPGKEKGFWHPDMWFSNYAYQTLTALLYVYFGFHFLPYFIVNLILRTFTAWSIYFFAKKVVTKTKAFTAAFFFALTVVGSETTDWVYNLNSYLGIGIALIGISYLIDKKPKTLSGWLLTLYGYIVVPIRLFILTTLMPIFYIFKTALNQKKLTLFVMVKSVISGLLAFLPFMLLRLIFPFLGWQKVNSELVSAGLDKVGRLLMENRYDFLLTPFTTVGQMIFPWGIKNLQEHGLLIYPIRNFIVYGFAIWLVGSMVYLAFYEEKTAWNAVKSFFVSGVILAFLKFFVRYQGQWALKEFANFVWTYLGLVFALALLRKTLEYIKKRDILNFLFYLVSGVFLMSYLYPWLYQPGMINAPQDRYLVVPSVGLSLIIGTILNPIVAVGKRIHIRKSHLIIFLFLVFLQIVSVQIYFSKKLEGRNYYMYNLIFSQIKESVPDLDITSPSLFYFEDFPPEVHESLLRFGFGYHMQLLYSYPFNEDLHPMSTDDKKDLSRIIEKYNVLSKNFFAFKWLDGKMVDITKKTKGEVYAK